MLVPVRAERQHIEGVVVGHPPLVAAHGVIVTAHERDKFILQRLFPVDAQAQHLRRDILQHPAPERTVRGQGEHVRVRQLEVFFRLPHRLADIHVLCFLQQRAPEKCPHRLRHVPLTLAALAPSVHQAVQIALRQRFPFPVQCSDTQFAVRIFKRQVCKEPFVQLRGAHAAPLAVFLPLRQHPLPEHDLLALRLGVAVERLKRFGCGGGRSIRRGRQLRSLAGVVFFLYILRLSR